MSPQYENIIVRQPLVNGSVVSHALRPVMHILNKVFDSDIMLLGNFGTVVDNLNSYKLTSLSFFVIFCPLCCG